MKKEILFYAPIGKGTPPDRVGGAETGCLKTMTIYRGGGIEAMSMGVVPVSTPAGGVCDVIRNHENGYISSSHSYKDYYETIKDAIANVGGVTSEYIITEYKEKYSMIACAKAYTEEFKK